MASSKLASILAVASFGCGAAPPPPQLPPPAETTVANDTPPSFAPFVGEWRAHGALLTVRADGSGAASWRVYRWCDVAPPPCDAKNGSEIVEGGHATFTLTSASASAAEGNVTSTTDPSALANGKITLVLKPGGVLRLEPWGRDFCGAGAASMTCGA